MGSYNSIERGIERAELIRIEMTAVLKRLGATDYEITAACAAWLCVIAQHNRPAVENAVEVIQAFLESPLSKK